VDLLWLFVLNDGFDYLIILKILPDNYCPQKNLTFPELLIDCSYSDIIFKAGGEKDERG